MKTRRSDSPFRNPIVIGAITLLITVIAVALAYNANTGLPFVPTYNLNVELPDAAGLNASDSVLVGGTRVGYIGGISPTTLPGGSVGAVVHLKLDKSIEPLPVDSTDLVRPVSPLGLKYLEIERGHSSQMLAPGATIPVSHTHLPVEIDDVLKMFNPPTRAASTANLDAFGDAFAGRGSDLNQALSGLHPLVDDLLAVTKNINDPRTGWSTLFPSLERTAREDAPVATQQAGLFAGLDVTFTPLSQATPALQAAIVEGPPALRTATRELPAQARFIDDSTELFRRFQARVRQPRGASTAASAGDQGRDPRIARGAFAERTPRRHALRPRALR